jgi:adenine/guanine phosphoribosyltransferase-like PRPP-binding protein
MFLYTLEVRALAEIRGQDDSDPRVLRTRTVLAARNLDHSVIAMSTRGVSPAALVASQSNGIAANGTQVRRSHDLWIESV